MMVVWIHAAYVIPEVATTAGAPYFGGAGVDLFFVISGFIIPVTTARNDLTPLKFLTLRIIRVVPLYWAATLGMAAWGVWGPMHLSFRFVSPAEAITKSLLFVPFSWYGTSGGMWPILMNGWTLNYEMLFYTLFACSLAAPRYARLPALAASLGSLVALGRLFGPFNDPLAAFYTNPFLLEFVVGMVLARDWLRNGWRVGFAQSAFLIALGFSCLGPVHSHLINMAGAFLVVGGCLHPRIGAYRNRVLLYLGDASYSIYLSHQFVLEAFAWLWARAFPNQTWASSVVFLVTGLGLCALIGCLCYRFIEEPLTSRLRKRVQRSHSASAAANRRNAAELLTSSK
jgi:exopolysaccharide production protein ExoZ